MKPVIEALKLSVEEEKNTDSAEMEKQPTSLLPKISITAIDGGNYCSDIC